MIAMQVGDDHGIDVFDRHVLPLQGDQGGRPAVEKETSGSGANVEAGVAPAVRSEGITTSKTLNEHTYSITLIRIYTISVPPGCADAVCGFRLAPAVAKG